MRQSFWTWWTSSSLSSMSRSSMKLLTLFTKFGRGRFSVKSKIGLRNRMRQLFSILIASGAMRRRRLLGLSARPLLMALKAMMMLSKALTNVRINLHLNFTLTINWNSSTWGSARNKLQMTSIWPPSSLNSSNQSQDQFTSALRDFSTSPVQTSLIVITFVVDNFRRWIPISNSIKLVLFKNFNKVKTNSSDLSASACKMMKMILSLFLLLQSRKENYNEFLFLLFGVTFYYDQ